MQVHKLWPTGRPPEPKAEGDGDGAVPPRQYQYYSRNAIEHGARSSYSVLDKLFEAKVGGWGMAWVPGGQGRVAAALSAELGDVGARRQRVVGCWVGRGTAYVAMSSAGSQQTAAGCWLLGARSSWTASSWTAS